MCPTLAASWLFTFYMLLDDQSPTLSMLWDSSPICLGVGMSFVSMSLLYRAIVHGFSLRQWFKTNVILFVAYGVVLFLYGLIVGRYQVKKTAVAIQNDSVSSANRSVL